MISAIAIDDEPLALEIVESFCAQSGLVKLEKTFTQTSEARKYLNSFPVDLIFLDINMPAVSGIDFYKGLKTETMVIFTTAHPQYAVEGFELSAVDYLLKPYSFERFSVAVQKANDYHNFLYHRKPAEQKHIFIRADYNLVKIQTSAILYMEGLADYLKIHFVDSDKPVITRMTMKGMLEKLQAKEFIRVHRSFIVPLNRIEVVRNKAIHLAGNEIPIGQSYEEEFTKAFKAR
jgi:DNA-binding LytR/AlgR family response regulator